MVINLPLIDVGMPEVRHFVNQDLVARKDLEVNG
jgi:hypothetical protein